MGPEFQPITARVSRQINIDGQHWNAIQLLSANLRNPHKQGWYFGAGDPEFWKFADRLLIPGGQALDLGMGRYYRSSLFFALQGMRITGYETQKEAVEIIDLVKTAYDLPIDLLAEDVLQADLGKNIYDTALLGQTFVHFPSKNAAFDTIERAVASLKPNGHLWLRVAGKESDCFRDLTRHAAAYPREVRQIDEDVYVASCGCSGRFIEEPYLFFNATELLYFLNKQNLRVIHSQTIPARGQANIMFGEDWAKDIPSEYQIEFITVIAQK